MICLFTRQERECAEFALLVSGNHLLELHGVVSVSEEMQRRLNLTCPFCVIFFLDSGDGLQPSID